MDVSGAVLTGANPYRSNRLIRLRRPAVTNMKQELLMAEERTIGQLVSQASEDLSALVRYEVALAKAEIMADVKRGAVGGGLFGAAGYLAFLASITLIVTIGFALVAAGLSAWLAFLVVTVALLLLAGLLGFLGFLQVKKIKPPQRSIASTKKTIAAVKGSVRS
ncbi:hypothetical protein Kisp02_69350 [Kineosporia sp. NBRC 101731]|nr:hypothetical protein Kisp02_69350 [Kineosporia sp. NBRC 101731]